MKRTIKLQTMDDHTTLEQKMKDLLSKTKGKGKNRPDERKSGNAAQKLLDLEVREAMQKNASRFAKDAGDNAHLLEEEEPAPPAVHRHTDSAPPASGHAATQDAPTDANEPPIMASGQHTTEAVVKPEAEDTRPQKEIHAPQATVLKKSDEQFPHEKRIKKIILVDDDSSTIETFKTLLGGEEVEIAEAHDGNAAWEIMRSGQFVPDAMLTGIVMPGMTGFELIQKMKNDPKLSRTKIIIFSHQGLPEHEEAARQMQVDDFMIRGMSTPREIARRLLFLSGASTVFKIAVSIDKHDGAAFVEFLSREQRTTSTPNISRETVIEVETGEKRGTYRIKLI